MRFEPVSDVGLRLRSSTEVLHSADGALRLICPGADDLVVREPEPIDLALVDLLRTVPKTPRDLERELRDRGHTDVARARASLHSLQEAGVITPVSAMDAAEDERYARQLPYVDDLAGLAGGQDRLREGTIVVLGCGGAGTWPVAALASAGVGGFVLVDDDVVETSNLNRQILYVASDVGRSKAACAGEWIQRFNPAATVDVHVTRVTTVAELESLFTDASFVIHAADWPPYEIESLVTRAAVKTNTPYIVCAQVPPILKVGPTFIPGHTACWHCQERQLERENPLYREIVAMRRGDEAYHVTVGPAAAAVGSFVSLEIMHFLLGLEPLATAGRALIVNMQTLESRWIAIERDPDCPVCGNQP